MPLPLNIVENMGESEFYITLPSNANLNEYPDNRPSNFKVNLSHKHELHDGVWEIGLSEIQFTRNWRYKTPAFDLVAWVGHYPVVEGRYLTRPRAYTMSDSEKRLLNVEETNFSFRQLITAYVKVPAGVWLDEYDFANVLGLRVKNALNVVIEGCYADRTQYPTFEYVRYERDSVSRKTMYHVKDLFIGFTTENDEMMNILGLPARSESSVLAASGKKVKAYMFNDDSGTSIQGGFPSLEVMFVYSSVCEEQHIGDQVGNLLKTVPVTVEPGKRQCERYSPTTYSRLRPSTLDCVDIQLLDKTGAEVAFGDLCSIAVLQLHVRKRRTSAVGWC